MKNWKQKLVLKPQFFLRRDQRGSAAVEFALTFPVLIIVTMMIFDIGRGMFFYTSVNNLAAEGVRYASVHGSGSLAPKTKAQIKAYILTRATGLDPAQTVITVTFDPNPSPGSAVEVTVQYNQAFFVSGLIQGFWGDSVDATITLSGMSRMGVY